MIVVTGASGFIGRAIFNELARQGEVGVGITRQPPATSSAHSFKAVDLVSGSIRLREILEECGASTLIHLALPPRESFQSEPELAEDSTRAIDSNVLRACTESATLRTIVLVSSSAVYGPLMPGEEAFTASRQPAPNSTYGRAKLEQEARWVQASLPTPVTVARIFNVTGPDEPASLVAGAITERLLGLPEGAELKLQSSESIRDFVDVRDAATALVALTRIAEQPNGSLNICSGTGTSISSLAEMIIGVSGKKVKFVPDGKGGESRSIGRIGPIGDKAGWRPRFSLHDSVRDLWESRVET